MKAGDFVGVRDESYAMLLNVKDGTLEHAFGCDLVGKIFKVIAMDQKQLPTGGCLAPDYTPPSNDVVCIHVESGNILFIASKMLSAQQKYCECCGKQI